MPDQRRAALVVGIDGYPDEPAFGCCNDAREMGRLLAVNADGSPNWEVERLLGRTASVPVVTTLELAERLRRHFAQAEDTDLLFYFSGHAVSSPLGVELCTQDGVDPASGFPLASLMALIRGARARSVTVILDCCFAGGVGLDESVDAVGDRLQLVTARVPEDVVILSSSQPAQASTQGAENSTFTRTLIDGLEGAAADLEGNVNVLSLFNHAHRAASRRGPFPELKANCDLLPVLRRTGPAIPLGRLRILPQYFEEPDDVVRLTPDHVWDGHPLEDDEDAHPQQRTLDYLRELRNAGLVTADERGSLLWLAQHGGMIRLTLRGRYYWTLVKANRL